MKKKFWIAIAMLTGLYIFIPEATDLVPFIGWLDEAAAFTVMTYALKQLGFDWSSFISKFFGKEEKDKTIIIK